MIRLLAAGLALIIAGSAYASELVQLTIQYPSFVCINEQAPPAWFNRSAAIWWGDGSRPAGSRFPSALEANGIVYLENYLPPGKRLPNPASIREWLVWDQRGIPYNASFYGDVSTAVDPMRTYITASGFPAVQNVATAFLKSLGLLQFRPNGTQLAIDKFQPPINYRPGDGIIVAPECVGSTSEGDAVSLFLNAKIEASGDLVDRPLASPATVYDTTVDASQVGITQGYSIRVVVPASTVSGTHIRVTTSSLVPSTVNHVSVGKRKDNTSGTTAAPTEVTFGGASGYTNVLSAVSDAIPFNVAVGDQLMITVSMFNATNSWSYQKLSPFESYYSSIDAWNTIAMFDPIHQRNRIHVVTKVEVLP